MKKGNILVLTYWSYDEALIQTYTLPYLKLMAKYLSPDRRIFLVTLEKKPLQQLQRTQTEDKLRLQNIEWLPFQYYPFGFRAILQWINILIALTFKITSKSIDYIHAWCTPAGAAGYLLSVITAKKLILDSYEPHAEAMIENKSWRRDGLAYKILLWFEEKQTRRATSVISTTAGMFNYARLKYKVTIDNFFVKPACVDLGMFSLSKKKDPDLLRQLKLENKIVCVYAGKFGGIYLDQEVFDFLAVAAQYWGGSFRVLLLTNSGREEIDRYCVKSGVSPDIVTIRFVNHSEIPKYMGLADFGITPVKPVLSKRYCTPIKDGEYWALGLPVVIPAGISDDSDIIEQRQIGAVLKNLNNDAYTDAVRTIDKLIHTPGIASRIRQVAIEYRCFDQADQIYKTIYS